MNAPFRTSAHHPPDTSQVDTVCSGMSQEQTIPRRENRLIKKRELAARLSISPRTVDDLVAKRTIPYIAISPRLHLFDLEAVQAALAKRFEVRVKGVFL